MNQTILDTLKKHHSRTSAMGAAVVRGKPAHNRLPGDLGAFNELYWRYLHRAQHGGVLFELSKDEFRRLTKMPCAYCGDEPRGLSKRKKGSAPPYVFNGIDQVQPGKGYTIENSAPCCAVCNYMKQDSSVEAFLAKVKAIYERIIKT